MLIIGVCGCTSKSQDKEVHKTIQLMWWGDIYNRAFIEKIVNVYNSKKPRIKVSIHTEVPRTYWQKLQTMLAAGTAPDIFLVNHEQAYELAKRDVFLNLNDHREDPAFITFQANIWNGLKGHFNHNENFYAIPIWTNVIGIFYNKDLFDKAGVEYPGEDWNFKELLVKAKQLTCDTDKDGRINQFGIEGYHFNFTNSWNLPGVVKAFGGEFFSEDGKRCLINSPEAMEAIQWGIDLRIKHHVSPTYSERQSMAAGGNLSGQDTFCTGKLAMLKYGRWYLDILCKTKPFRWGFAPLPRGKKKVVFQRANYLGVYSKTKYPKAAWKFLKFMVGEEAQRMLSQERTDIPVFRSIAYSSEFLSYGGREDVNRIFLQLMEDSVIKRTIGKDEWKQNAKDKIELVYLGRMKLEEACSQIVKEFNAE